MGYDLNAELTLKEKTLLLREASRKKWCYKKNSSTKVGDKCLVLKNQSKQKSIQKTCKLQLQYTNNLNRCYKLKQINSSPIIVYHYENNRSTKRSIEYRINLFI